MKNYLKLIGSLYLFWIIFFLLLRILFIFFQWIYGSPVSLSEMFYACIYGSYMDISMASYFIIPFALLFFLHRWISLNSIIIKFHWLLIFIVVILFATDTVLYNEWGFRLDKTVFKYLKEVTEAANFISLRNAIYFLLLFFTGCYLGFRLFKLIFVPLNSDQSKIAYLINCFLLPLLIIPMRGGIGIIPMNQAKVYFSAEPFYNHAALNVPWNLMFGLLQKDAVKLKWMDDATAENLNVVMFKDSLATSDLILKNKKPKILFITLESFTAKFIDKVYQGITVTPGLNEWIRKGIYFNEAYSSGDRTEIGMAAIFSGFPAQPNTAIVHYPNKTSHLPSFIHSLKEHGYHTTFYYGGDASFANMQSYLYNASCDVIIDKHQFPSETYNAKWGVHDHLLFQKLFEDIRNDSSLFLKICLSLSSHPPYDLPVSATWQGQDEEILFLNTAHYTDQYLKLLLDNLSQLPVWNDLLIILCADHGAKLPGNDAYHLPQKFKIPLWFGGGAINTIKTYNQVVSQTDIAASVLYQMGISKEEFKFSKNIFSDSAPAFALYAFNNGFGLIDRSGSQVFFTDHSQQLITSGKPQFDIQYAKAMMQLVINEFEKL